MIKDVSKEWAALLESQEEEDNRYSNACDQACQRAREKEQQAIDEQDVEEVLPDEVGIEEANRPWDNDIQKDARGQALVKVDNHYINAVKKALARLKSSNWMLYDSVMKKLQQYMAQEISLPPPEDFAQTFMPQNGFYDKSKPDSEDYSDTDNAFGSGDAEYNLWGESEGEGDQKKAATEAFNQSKEQIEQADVTPDYVKKFLSDNKDKIEEVKRKIPSDQLKSKIDQTVKMLDDYSKGKLQVNELNEAKWTKGKHPLMKAVKGAMLFLVWTISLLSYPIKWTGWLLNKIAEQNDKFMVYMSKKLAEGEILEYDGDPLDEIVPSEECGISDVEADPILNQPLTDQNKIRFMAYVRRKYKIDCYDFDGQMAYDQETGDDITCLVSDGSLTWRDGLEALKAFYNVFSEADYREPASHLLDPVGVKASTASLKAQDTAQLAVVEKLLEKIDRLEMKLEESKKKSSRKNSSDAASSESALNEEDSDIAEDLKDIQKWYAHLMKALTSAPNDKEVIEKMVKVLKQMEYGWTQEKNKPHGWEAFPQIMNSIVPVNDLAQLFQATSNQIGIVILQNMALPFQFIGQVSAEVKYTDMIQKFLKHTVECRKYLASKIRDVDVLSQKLKEGELEGKPLQEGFGKAIGGSLGSIGGALAGAAGGSMLGNLFPGGAGAAIGGIAGGIAGGMYGKEYGEKGGERAEKYIAFKVKHESEKKNRRDKNIDGQNLLLGDEFFSEADNFGSLTDDQLQVLDALQNLEDRESDEVKQNDIKRAKALQELSYERELTKAETDEFVQIVNKYPDIGDALITLSKTGFARPGNHIGRYANDEHGNRVEIPPFNYTEDPEDHFQRRSKDKREQKERTKRGIQDYQDRAKTMFDQSFQSNDEVSLIAWRAALASLTPEEQKTLMDEMIEEINQTYAGKDDYESQKARESEMWYVWKIFGHEPNTRELGKAWGVSHVAAGKHFNKTIQLMKDAFKYAGVNGINTNVTPQQLKKIIAFINERPGRRNRKINAKRVQPKAEEGQPQ